MGWQYDINVTSKYNNIWVFCVTKRLRNESEQELRRRRGDCVWGKKGYWWKGNFMGQLLAPKKKGNFPPFFPKMAVEWGKVRFFFHFFHFDELLLQIFVWKWEKLALTKWPPTHPLSIDMPYLGLGRPWARQKPHFWDPNFLKSDWKKSFCMGKKSVGFEGQLLEL